MFEGNDKLQYYFWSPDFSGEIGETLLTPRASQIVPVEQIIIFQFA